MGLPVPDWILTSTLLHNLKDSYESFVSSTLQNICGFKPDLNQIISQLLDKKHQQTSSNKTTALLTKKGNLHCNHCNCNNHSIDNCWQLHPEKTPKDRSSKHYQKDKTNKKDKKSNKNKTNNKKEDDNNKTKKTRNVLMSASSFPSAKQTDTWFINLGATQNMCVN